jgi:hypothetical protein
MPKGGKRGRPKGRKNTQPMRKINSTRKAYSKPVRNQMMLRRAGVVETKVRVDSDVAAVNGHTEENDWLQPLAWKPLGYSNLVDVANLGTNAFGWVPLQSFTRISRGLGDDQMIGNNITSKYLKVKAQFRFPNNKYILRQNGGDIEVEQERNLNVFIENQCKLYFICGWVTKHMGRPIQISRSGDGLLAKQVTEDSLARYVCDQVEPYFNDDTDKLEFRPRSTTNIRIEHYSRVKPALDSAIATKGKPQEDWSSGENPNWEIAAHGSIPDVYKSYTFKTGRKIQMTLGQPAEENAPNTDTQNYYPNDNWIPFCITYNPDYEELLKQYVPAPSPGTEPYHQKVCQIQFRHNSAHYYTDG